MVKSLGDMTAIQGIHERRSHQTPTRRCSMHRLPALFLAMALLLLFPLGTNVLSAASPEEVGLSSERLARIGQALTRQIEARSFPGAVALVARKGRIAYFEAFGQLDSPS